MNDSFRVLVIDEATDTGEVLKAVYEPHGGRVNCVHSFRRLSTLPKNDVPDVLVLHESSELSHHPDVETQFANVPRVIIGSSSLQQTYVDPDSPSTPSNAMASQNLRVSEPFEYRDLIQSVDSLLNKAA